MRVVLRSTLALVYLHNKGIAHCGIKLRNIFVCSSDQNALEVKLGNFGQAIFASNFEKLKHTEKWNRSLFKGDAHLANQKGPVDITKFDLYCISKLCHTMCCKCKKNVAECPILSKTSSLITCLMSKLVGPLDSRPTPLEAYFVLCLYMWPDTTSNQLLEDKLYVEYCFEKTKHLTGVFETTEKLMKSWTQTDFSEENTVGD